MLAYLRAGHAIRCVREWCAVLPGNPWHNLRHHFTNARRSNAVCSVLAPIIHGQILTVVRASTNNHRQVSPTTRASATATMPTLTGVANPPWRVTSLAPCVSPRLTRPTIRIPSDCHRRRVTALRPPRFTASLRQGIQLKSSWLNKYAVQSCFCPLSSPPLTSLSLCLGV